jgi:transcriptional regulator with XRE-family HTH domain
VPIYRTDPKGSVLRRPPSIVLRKEVNRMAQDGLSGSEIAKRLGITRQLVHWFLKGKPRKRRRTRLVCADCGMTIAKVMARYRDITPVYCPRCLLNNPRVPFGIRLRLVRLARGWTMAELARRSGIASVSLSRYELGIVKPRPKRAEQLIGLFGRN